MHRRSLLAGLAAGLPILPLRAQGTVPVVASFTILADMARNVGGERVAVRQIAGPDVDAHGFQPRPSDAAAIRDATATIRNGLGFDPWFDRLAHNAHGRMITASEGIAPRAMPGGAPDPHAWQDLRHGQSYVRTIAAGLAAADPEGAATYRANAEAYLARLADLDAWVRAQIATVPPERRRVVTSHDAFGYFGAAYGVEFLAPQGISTEAQPSAANVARLIRQIRAERITAVFVESMTSLALVNRLAAEANVRVSGRLYVDALSAPDGPAPSYEAMFRHNLGLLVPAMRGEAPQ